MGSKKPKLSALLADLWMGARDEVKWAKLRAKSNPARFRAGLRYWEGMAQGYANALSLARAQERRDAKA